MESARLGNRESNLQSSFLWFLRGLALFNVFFIACSAPATKMKCAELRMRLNNETLSDDQKQFMSEELKECEQQVSQARQQDSATMNNLEKRFSPQTGDSL